METHWYLILLSISLALLLKSIFFPSKTPSHPLPPGPQTFPVIGNIIWFKKNAFSDFQHVLETLTTQHGPIVTLHVGSKPGIWVADRSIAHQALVQNGAVFADRPPAMATTNIITSNQHDIHSSFYGPMWRLFRRNLAAEILNPSRVKSYGPARSWALQILLGLLMSEQNEKGTVSGALDHFRHAMFCLLALMCFGEKLEKQEIEKIEEAQYVMLHSYSKFGVLNIWPSLTKLLLRSRWKELLDLRKYQENTIVPFINARKQKSTSKTDQEFVLCYADTLLDLELPEEKRKLTDGEMVSLCSEFLNAGTDPTATAMQWIMANLLKYPTIQEKIYSEIKSVVADNDQEEIREEDLTKLPYLKSVILEGLRRHPPGHFLSHHRVTEDTVLGGYMVPKKGTINFMVAKMGRDPNVWEDPMEFKPERFMESEGVVDITGSREIKMMPFGAGRRICPGYGLAILHLEYFVANLVWNLEWTSEEEIDLTEKQQFITMVMKNPFKARVSQRKR